MYWQVNQDGASLIGPMDRGDVWFFMPTGMKEGETLPTRAAGEAIRRATGLDLPFEVLSTDEWVASHLLADRCRQGRIFLAGDACHLHPPFGGYGMNMGVGDGVDLGWKLAAVLQGWGGGTLLDSYGSERRPVHRAVIDEALAKHAVLGSQLFREGLEDDTTEARPCALRLAPTSEGLRRASSTRLGRFSASATKRPRSSRKMARFPRRAQARPTCRAPGPDALRHTLGWRTDGRSTTCSVPASLFSLTSKQTRLI